MKNRILNGDLNISYEIIKFAGKHSDNKFVNILNQGFTDDGTQWLLDYWEAHCNEMNLLSRKETEDENELIKSIRESHII